jgi:hypothetical protein
MILASITAEFFGNLFPVADVGLLQPYLIKKGFDNCLYFPFQRVGCHYIDIYFIAIHFTQY